MALVVRIGCCSGVAGFQMDGSQGARGADTVVVSATSATQRGAIWARQTLDEYPVLTTKTRSKKAQAIEAKKSLSATSTAASPVRRQPKKSTACKAFPRSLNPRVPHFALSCTWFPVDVGGYGSKEGREAGLPLPHSAPLSCTRRHHMSEPRPQNRRPVEASSALPARGASGAHGPPGPPARNPN